MLFKCTRSWPFLLIVLLLAVVTQTESLAGHPPYVDPHFDLHHTPKYDYGARPTHSDYGHLASSGSSHAMTCNICNGSGSNLSSGSVAGFVNPICPPATNAILKLWVPDGLAVEVNGQPTKPQTLGGIHKDSRIFSLEGLQSDRVSPCVIEVTSYNEFGATKLSKSLSVQAGGHYNVRYPHDFEAAPAFHEIPQNEMYYPSSETSISTPIHDGTTAPPDKMWDIQSD